MPQQPTHSHQPNPTAQPQIIQKVVVTDVDISFRNMINLLVKFAFASIPALLVIWVIGAIFVAFVTAVFGVTLGSF